MPDRIADFYQRHALAIDAARRRSFPERGWLERFARKLPQQGQVLDLGCGGGEPIARFLIDLGFRVTGVDVAPGMIALARTRFGRHRWIEGDMRNFESDAGGFDGIVVWNSLHHLEPTMQARMITRIADWLKRGGVALLGTNPCLTGAPGDIPGERPYHASLSPSEYRAEFARNGLAVLGNVVGDTTCAGATVWLVGRV